MFHDAKGKILYVGKAKDLKARVSSYFTGQLQLGPKTARLVTQIEKIKIITVESELESLLLEAFYIKKFVPKYNIRLVDNKTYPMIEISSKNTYPAIVMTRKINDKTSSYFGPYPSSSSIKLVLRTLRKAFPYMSTLNHPKKFCLYYHLGLCPCLPANDNKENRAKYKKDLKQIIRILEGESQILLKELLKKRVLATKQEQYEEALVLQKQIEALEFITKPYHSPDIYDLNPNLRDDLRSRELNELQVILEKSGYTFPKKIYRIECYDISHIQGSNTVASMVVFTRGEKDSKYYRRFKIRLEKTPDDFASMQEVLRRRLKHTEWPMPELFIVDGGKGQVSSALEVFAEMQLSIPLIGLAKREEIIIVPTNHPQNKQNSKEAFTEIALPKNTKALQLIMRLRDEAHRFAITYHRKLRSKGFLSPNDKMIRKK